MAEPILLERDRLKQAVERAIDEVYLTLAKGRTKDIRDQDEDWQERYDQLRDDSAKVQKRMTSEIEALKKQVTALQSALDDAKAADSSADTAKTGTGIPESIGASAADKKDDKSMARLVESLQKSLEKYRVRQQMDKAQHEELVALAMQRKAESFGWMRYAESLQLQLQKLGKKKTAGNQVAVLPTNSPSLVPLTKPSVPIADDGPTAVSPAQPLSDSEEQAEVAKPMTSSSLSSPVASSFRIEHEEDDGSVEPELPPQNACQFIDQKGSQGPAYQPTLDSTQGEPSSSASQQELPTPRANDTDRVASHSTVKFEPSSDTPEIIWERATKKPKKDDQSGQHWRVINPQAQQHLPVVKKENSSCTQRMHGIKVFRDSQESVDLDEGQLTVQTPRKRNLSFEQQVHSDQDSQDFGEEAPEQEACKALLNTTRQSIVQPDPSVPQTVVSVPLTPSTPLASLSTNIQRGTKGPARALKRGIESLAEDGQILATPYSVARGTRPGLRSSKTTPRLNSLLNSRPSDPDLLLSTPRQSSLAVERPQRRTESPTKQISDCPPPTRSLRHLRHSDVASPRSPSIRTPSAVTEAAGVTNSPAAEKPGGSTAKSLATPLLAAKADGAAKKRSALRSRPVDQLKMDDFKINPALNDGETFAYSEVVRSRADRANLAGCTDPQCCGKAFRGMAVSELDAAGPAHVRRPESVILMERYLGDKAYQIAQMDPAELSSLWIEARVKELADRFGKHRHRYHRRASPPGFWDTDFPTTQDEERYRLEADKVERITVQERYHEAIRPEGGRWLFRDE
ncbi:hypothetical protein SEPCBS119000_004120 [Sporothrix epigloea]|uniref:DNA endonuclease activator Ctp1 C-terminal domain-containing protein n=1 Tax=Sporothrix epigloea TaxID=1892477 RepID=A0ABP0DQD3_9PEZI